LLPPSPAKREGGKADEAEKNNGNKRDENEWYKHHNGHQNASKISINQASATSNI
jgi:hypothetical protein